MSQLSKLLERAFENKGNKNSYTSSPWAIGFEDRPYETLFVVSYYRVPVLAGSTFDKSVELCTDGDFYSHDKLIDAVREALPEYHFTGEVYDKHLEEQFRNIIYFGEQHYITKDALSARASEIAAEFVAKMNKNGKPDSRHSMTFDFGSPFDEMDMQCEYDRDTRSWWTRCMLYDKDEDGKGHSSLSAICSVETTTDTDRIADHIFEFLSSELDAHVEPEHYFAMRDHFASKKKPSIDAQIQSAGSRAARQENVSGIPTKDVTPAR